MMNRLYLMAREIRMKRSSMYYKVFSYTAIQDYSFVSKVIVHKYLKYMIDVVRKPYI